MKDKMPVTLEKQYSGKKLALLLIIVFVLTLIKTFIPGLDSLKGVANLFLIVLILLAANLITNKIYPLIK